jgi:putative chitinase
MPFVVTAEHLALIAGRPTPLMPSLAEWMDRICPAYDIDSPQEFCHFLAQACHETDHFRTLREYASGRACEGRSDLGNTQPGDDVRFRGHGIFQTTGRANYLQLGLRKGQRDLFVDNPELLAQAEHAVWSACEYWRRRGLNDIANQDDGTVLKKKLRGQLIDVSPVEYISITIDGGMNGLAERRKFYAVGQRVLVGDAPAAHTARGARRAGKAAPGHEAKAAGDPAHSGEEDTWKRRHAGEERGSRRRPAPARKSAPAKRKSPVRKPAAAKRRPPAKRRAG